MMSKKLQQTAELVFIFLLFFLSSVSSFFHTFWLNPGYVFVESVFWLISAIIVVRILYRQNMLSIFFENLRRNWIIYPFLIFSCLSVFWSSYWEISLYRWLILFVTIIASAYIGLRFEMKKIVELLSIFGIYILLLSALVILFMPRVGVMNYYIIHDAWKGLYWHKNHLGIIASLINLLFLINLVDSIQVKKKRIYFWALLYLISLFYVIKADSVAAYFTTMFLNVIVVLALVFLKYKNTFRRSHSWLFVTGLIIGALILYLKSDYLFELFNRNTSLTGRVPMWSYLFETYFSKKPVLGYGFNAFWYSVSHRIAMQIAADYPDPIVISDNGFIDILINTGYIGLGLFAVLYFGIWWRSIGFARKATGIFDFFPLILMSYSLLANISWSLLFENESFLMLIMLAVLFCITNFQDIGKPIESTEADEI